MQDSSVWAEEIKERSGNRSRKNVKADTSKTMSGILVMRDIVIPKGYHPSHIYLENFIQTWLQSQMRMEPGSPK